MQCSNINIMAKVGEYLNKFVELINKEKSSENIYYNFQEKKDLGENEE